MQEIILNKDILIFNCGKTRKNFWVKLLKGIKDENFLEMMRCVNCQDHDVQCVTKFKEIFQKQEQYDL